MNFLALILYEFCTLNRIYAAWRKRTSWRWSLLPKHPTFFGPCQLRWFQLCWTLSYSLLSLSGLGFCAAWTHWSVGGTVDGVWNNHCLLLNRNWIREDKATHSLDQCLLMWCILDLLSTINVVFIPQSQGSSLKHYLLYKLWLRQEWVGFTKAIHGITLIQCFWWTFSSHSRDSASGDKHL